MKQNVVALLIAVCSLPALAQTRTTDNLQKKYTNSFSLFFYHNTLRMINQSENKEFDEIIRNIEKMKFLMIEKGDTFTTADYKKLTQSYTTEAFEGVMNSRHQGRNFDVYLKEKDGKTKGMVVLVNDSTNLYILDVVGSIALDKVTTLYSVLDDSADVGKKIKNFTDRNSKRKDGDKDL
jgi:hypothetical protein